MESIYDLYEYGFHRENEIPEVYWYRTKTDVGVLVSIVVTWYFLTLVFLDLGSYTFSRANGTELREDLDEPKCNTLESVFVTILYPLISRIRRSRSLTNPT